MHRCLGLGIIYTASGQREWRGKALQDFGAVRAPILVPHPRFLHEHLEFGVRLLCDVGTAFGLFEAETHQLSVLEPIGASRKDFVRDAVDILEVGTGRIGVGACFSEVPQCRVEVLRVYRHSDIRNDEVPLYRAQQEVEPQGSESRMLQGGEGFLAFPVAGFVAGLGGLYRLPLLMFEACFCLHEAFLQALLLPLKRSHKAVAVGKGTDAQFVHQLEAQDTQEAALEVSLRSIGKLGVLEEAQGSAYPREFASFVLTHGLERGERGVEVGLLQRGSKRIVYPLHVDAAAYLPA